jgi:hypothetical protein
LEKDRRLKRKTRRKRRRRGQYNSPFFHSFLVQSSPVQSNSPFTPSVPLPPLLPLLSLCLSNFFDQLRPYTDTDEEPRETKDKKDKRKIYQWVDVQPIRSRTFRPWLFVGGHCFSGISTEHSAK